MYMSYSLGSLLLLSPTWQAWIFSYAAFVLLYPTALDLCHAHVAGATLPSVASKHRGRCGSWQR